MQITNSHFLTFEIIYHLLLLNRRDTFVSKYGHTSHVINLCAVLYMDGQHFTLKQCSDITIRTIHRTNILEL